MTMKYWIAKHTGLPSFYSDTDIAVVAAGDRVLHARGDGAPFFICDALASPGVPTRYTAGSASVELERAATTDRRVGMLTTITGRAVEGVLLVNNQDPQNWKSSAHRYSNNIVRWGLHKEPESGESTLLLLDPDQEEQVLKILQDTRPIIIGPAVPTPGVPLRAVVVDSYKRSRLRLGRIRIDVAWTESTLGESGAAPLITWGDWAAWRAKHGANKDASYAELARLIAGMP